MRLPRRLAVAFFVAVFSGFEGLAAVRDRYGNRLELHDDYFDKVMGTSSVREAFVKGAPTAAIVAAWDHGLREFNRLRTEYLLY